MKIIFIFIIWPDKQTACVFIRPLMCFGALIEKVFLKNPQNVFWWRNLKIIFQLCTLICRSVYESEIFKRPRTENSTGVTFVILLTLNAPITTKVGCFFRLLKCLRSFYGKQCGPRTDSYRSSLFWVHAVCCSGSTLFASVLNSSVM